MNLLILDNNIVTDWGAPDLQRQVAAAREGERVSFSVRRPPQQDIPADVSRFDAVLLSGSATSAVADAPWIAKLHGFVEDWLTTGKPLLGVCYGHQVLARVLGARERKLVVRSSPTPEYGWKEIELLDPSDLTAGLPRRFWSYQSHKDEVHELPSGVRLLARTKDCGIQAMQLGTAPVFGIQFHPECTPTSTTVITRKPKVDTRRHDPKIARAIFGNFFALASQEKTS